MIRILSIEFLLMFVLGAILFRIAWAFADRRLVCWGLVAAAALLVLLFLPGHIDEALVAEFGGKLPAKRLLNPLEINLIRALGLLLGALLADRIIARRRRLGLEDKPPYDDFP